MSDEKKPLKTQIGTGPGVPDPRPSTAESGSEINAGGADDTSTVLGKKSGTVPQKTMIGAVAAPQPAAPVAAAAPTDPEESRDTIDESAKTGKQQGVGLQTGGAIPVSELMGMDEEDSLAEQRVGTELGGYHIIRKLAEGGMGVVYEAEHTKIGRKGAIKVLKAEFCQDPTVVERFYQEARAVNEIGHENIVDIFDFGKTPEGGVYFVMDFLQGQELSDRLKAGPVSWKESLSILRQAILALKAAHAKGFVHRDLKPDNIFLEDKDGTPHVKLLDFGIAKLVGMEGAEEKLTRTGSMIGTPHYMSPEQINGSASIDHRTDIYSMGIIMYEMFSGATPFQGNTLGEIITGHLLEDAPRLKDIREDLGVPKPIADIIHRMLAKKPEERYDHIEDVLSDLLDIDKDRDPERATALDETRPITTVGSTRAPALTVADAPKKSSKLPLMFGGVGFLAAAVAGAMLLTKGDKTSEAPAPTPVVTEKEDETPAPPVEEAIDYEELRENAHELIRQALAEAVPGTRVRGSDAAADTLDPGSAALLFEMAQNDPSEEVRGHAAFALAQIGHADAKATFAALEKKASVPLQPWYAAALLKLGDEGARKRLIKYAKSDNLAVALKATLSLADASQPGDKESIKALERLAKREAELNEVVPFAGALLLTKLAALRSPGARGILYQILEQDNEGAKLAAAEGLARLGDDGGAEVLTALMGTKGAKEQLSAAVTLVLLGDYSGYELLRDALASEHPEERAQAARGLGLLGAKKAVKALMPLLEDKEWPVRLSAAVAIVAIVGLDPALLAQASVDWAGSALQSEDWEARQAAAGVLGDMPEKEAVPLLAQAIADTKKEVRVAAARSAAKMKSPEVAKKVASAALVEKDPVAKEEQVKALGSIGSAEVADTLRELQNEKGRVGVFAAGSLIAVGDESGKEKLVAAVEDKSTNIRLAAVESATLAKNKTVVPVLATGATDRVFDVRFKASEGLAVYGEEKDLAVPVLEDGLKSKSVSIKARAQVSLAKFGVQSDEAMSPDELLASDDPQDRLAAIAVVESMSWKEARSRLRQLITDPALAVRRRAVDALALFVDKDKEGVIALYKSLTKDSDSVTRAKAQAQLSKLVEPLAPKAKKTGKVETQPDPIPEPVDAGPSISPEQLAKMDSILKELASMKREAEAELETVQDSGNTLASIMGRSQRNDKAVERARRAIEKIGKGSSELEDLARDASKAGDELDAFKPMSELPEVSERLDKAEGLIADIKDAQKDADALSATALSSAEALDSEAATAELTESPPDAGAPKEPEAKEPEAKDPIKLLADSEDDVKAGKFAAARRKIKEARKVIASTGAADIPGLHFVEGLANRGTAEASNDTEKETRYLRKAQENFFAYLRSGETTRLAEAKQQLAEIGPVLTDLLMAPEGEEKEEGGEAPIAPTP